MTRFLLLLATLLSAHGEPEELCNREPLNGYIIGEVTSETLLKRKSFLIWQGGQPGDPENRAFRGMLGVQVHVGPPMKIEYRSIRLKTIPAGEMK